MQNEMAEKYRLQYLLLVKEFLREVERGAEWPAVRVILQEMKRINYHIESLDDLLHTGGMNDPGFLIRA